MLTKCPLWSQDSSGKTNGLIVYLSFLANETTSTVSFPDRQLHSKMMQMWERSACSLKPIRIYWAYSSLSDRDLSEILMVSWSSHQKICGCFIRWQGHKKWRSQRPIMKWLTTSRYVETVCAGRRRLSKLGAKSSISQLKLIRLPAGSHRQFNERLGQTPVHDWWMKEWRERSKRRRKGAAGKDVGTMNQL